MSGVLYIAGLSHLDKPIIEYISRNIVSGTSFEVINFYNYYASQVRSYSNPFDEGYIEVLEKKASDVMAAKLKNPRLIRNNIRKWQAYSSELRIYKSKLLRFLEENNPDYILAASDHCLTLDLLKDTTFFEKITIIQPALITHLSPTFGRVFRNIPRKALNKIFHAPMYEVDFNWGDRGFNCKYLLWSKLESHHMFKNFGICGDLMMENNPLIQFEDSTGLESILVVLPNFSVESEEVVKEIVHNLRRVTDHFKNSRFIFKWHPTDLRKDYFNSVTNGIDFEQFSHSEGQKFDFVISSLSALAINLRRQTSRIAIYHPGKYGSIKIPYFSDEYFKNCKDADEIILEINSRSTTRIDTYKALFTCDDPTKEFLSGFISFE